VSRLWGQPEDADAGAPEVQRRKKGAAMSEPISRSVASQMGAAEVALDRLIEKVCEDVPDADLDTIDATLAAAADLGWFDCAICAGANPSGGAESDPHQAESTRATGKAVS
jgi:hypothetical protein